jgi:hypothetical protein
MPADVFIFSVSQVNASKVLLKSNCHCHNHVSNSVEPYLPNNGECLNVEFTIIFNLFQFFSSQKPSPEVIKKDQLDATITIY